MDLLEGYQCGACPAGYIGETLRGYELHDSMVLQQASLLRLLIWQLYGSYDVQHNYIPGIAFTELE